MTQSPQRERLPLSRRRRPSLLRKSVNSPVSATPTHTLRVCVNSHRSPAKNHKETFPLSYFCVTKSTKSQQGGLTPSSFRTSCGVHELVAGSSAWRARATNSKVKVDSLALSATSCYHACEHSARKSRADSCTHCLHAR